ncbi:MAG: hypothetical protein LBG60_05840 [Bifidobacteriaceae bacterium]|nr:hypothetical protein [Bifidobacteriaceae bacterium]
MTAASGRGGRPGGGVPDRRAAPGRAGLPPGLAVRLIGSPEQGAATVETTWREAAADPGADSQLDLTVTVLASAPWRGRVEVAASLAAREPWWLIPGLFYGQNRPEACRRLFPRYQTGVCDRESLTSDHWSFRADRAATVAVFAWGDQAGVALAAGQTTACGMTGLGFAGRDGRAEIKLLMPYAEEPWTYYGDSTARPALFEVLSLEAGESATFDCQVFRLGPDRHGYAPILRALRDRAAPANPVKPWVSIPQAADLTAEALHRWHYRDDPGVLIETAAFDRAINGDALDRQAMHVAWVSGIPWAYALLRHARRRGRRDLAAAGRRVIDFICSELSPSGTFWGVWYKQHGWRGSWTELDWGLHARTLAEATLFLLRALREEERAGLGHPAWGRAAASNLRHMLERQRADGALGAIHHALSGEVLDWDGAAGLTWIPAFVEAAELADRLGLDRDRLLAAAESAGHYYSTYVLDEFINGAPEDVDLAPTSEDGYAAVMAYVALARACGRRAWLDLAERSFDWMDTFRYSYNVQFDPETILGAYGFATRGGDQASVSNQHIGSYGLICAAELAELAGLTGSAEPLARNQETLACFRQFIARRDGDFNARRGMVTERYYQTECFAPKGMVLTLSHAWCLGVVLLACEQAQTGWSRLSAS